MKPALRCFRFGLAVIALGLTAARLAAAAEHCAPVEPASAPTHAISNGLIQAVVLLPDAEHGYYRGVRFDWSGAIWCLTYQGHNYFGVWMPAADGRPTNPTGPVEEFRSGDGQSSPAYDEAKPGDPFVKPGVGLLRRIDTQPYRFQTQYPIIDGGKWIVHAGSSQVVFRQTLQTPLGIAYDYQKTLRLESGKPVLVIQHVLKNTGSKPIDIQIYNHDFFVLDGVPTGPGMQVHFPFTPQVSKPLTNGARIDGKQIVYDSELTQGQASGDISGFSAQASDFHFVVENAGTGVGVEEIGDQPLSKLVFWSNPRTICPEAYVHLTIAPGKTGRWSIRYRFFAKQADAPTL